MKSWQELTIEERVDLAASEHYLVHARINFLYLVLSAVAGYWAALQFLEGGVRYVAFSVAGLMAAYALLQLVKEKRKRDEKLIAIKGEKEHPAVRFLGFLQGLQTKVKK